MVVSIPPCGGQAGRRIRRRKKRGGRKRKTLSISLPNPYYFLPPFPKPEPDRRIIDRRSPNQLELRALKAGQILLPPLSGEEWCGAYIDDIDAYFYCLRGAPGTSSPGSRSSPAESVD